MPNATDFQLHIFAALAQEERRLISERTKAALAEAKRQGKILGSNGRNLAAKNRKAADEFASQLRDRLDEDLLQCSYSEIARHLNDSGITTATGRKFFPQTVKNYLVRLGLLATGT
ncbi:DNA invertase Pin-like site-specific DNA recombinase [Bradyrhizobium sp. GM0.4]